MILKSTEEIIGSLERGDLSKDFNSGVHEVLQKLAEQDGGSGTVTLKLKIQSKGEMVTIKSTVDTTLPKKERRTSNFFLTGDGRLSMQHPDQVDMGFDRRRDASDVET